MTEKRENFDVVIVDDDTLTLEYVKHLFQGTSHNVHCFSDERVALEYMKCNKASILIVDQRMPHITGLEFLKELQECNRVAESDLYLYSAAELPDFVRETAENRGIKPLSKDTLVSSDDFVKLFSGK